MSDLLGIILATAASSSSPDVHEGVSLPEPLKNAISLEVPAIDGLRGIGASYERFVPQRRLSLAAIASIRQVATGDYGAGSVGIGGEARWYWRAPKGAWLSKLPANSMAGWFLGGRVELALSATHDRIEDRWFGEALDLGVTALIGYRIVPWRRLEITPSAGLGVRRQFDLTGRLPGYNHGTAVVGLSVGWLF